MTLISVEEAQSRLMSLVPEPPVAVERVPLSQGLNKVLAEPMLAKHFVPPADNSAMDGFAVRSREVIPGKPLLITQTIAAGSVAAPLEISTAARIFTGGQLPKGADAVLIQEDAEWHDRQLYPKVGIAEGSNIRRKGQDIQAGARIADSGQRLKPADLSLLASVGIADVPVFKPLTVAIFSTGDELVEPPNVLRPGQIYNSNRFALQGLLTQMGISVIDLGIVPDDLAETTDRLASAAQSADAIMSSGGVSVGDRDFVKTAVEQLGALDVWKLAIKPGKPMAFGHVRETPFFGLPGNPVSTFVTFLVLAKPFLEQLQGQKVATDETWPGISTFAFKAGGRQEYLRVRASRDDQGIALERYEAQGSGVMSSLAWANALAIVSPLQDINPGDTVPFMFLDRF
jgi:molybdopterin molybdotransferase